jgi:hypothetical protein
MIPASSGRIQYIELEEWNGYKRGEPEPGALSESMEGQKVRHRLKVM